MQVRWSARDFFLREGLEAQEYFVYFKLSNCAIGEKEPLTAGMNF